MRPWYQLKKMAAFWQLYKVGNDERIPNTTRARFSISHHLFLFEEIFFYSFYLLNPPKVLVDNNKEYSN